MSWLFSQALVEEFSEGTSLAGAPCAALNVMPSPHPFLRNDKPIAASGLSRFGPTCAVLTADAGEELLTSFLAAFPAPTSASPATAQESTERSRGCGARWGVSLAKLDPITCSLKTHQRSLLEEGFESLETLPPWGTIADGELFQQPTPSGLLEIRSSITSESGSGLPQRAPTPTAGDAKSSGSRNLEGSKAHAGVSLTDYVKTGNSTTPRRAARVPTPTVTFMNTVNHNPQPGAKGRPALAALVRRIPTPTVQDSSNNGAPSQMNRNTKPLNAEVGGPLNPTWVEWLMGWPIGWTDLNAPATDKFRQWCASHGAS
jgi:hypothetical protein